MSAITDENKIIERLVQAGYTITDINALVDGLAKEVPGFADNRTILLTMLASRLEVSLIIENPLEEPLKAAEINKLTADRRANYNGYFLKYTEKNGKSWTIMLDNTGELWISQFEADGSKLREFKPGDKIAWKNMPVKVKGDRVYCNIYKDTTYTPYIDSDGYICKKRDIKAKHVIRDVLDRSNPVDYVTIKGALTGPVVQNGEYNGCVKCGKAGRPEKDFLLYCRACGTAARPEKYPSYHCNIDDKTGVIKVLLTKQVITEAQESWGKGTVIFVNGYYNDERNHVSPSIMFKVADPAEIFKPDMKNDESVTVMGNIGTPPPWEQPVKPFPITVSSALPVGSIKEKETTGHPVSVPDPVAVGVSNTPNSPSEHFEQAQGMRKLGEEILALLDRHMDEKRGHTIDDLVYEFDAEKSKIEVIISYLKDKGLLREPLPGQYKTFPR